MTYHRQPLVYLIDSTSPFYTRFDKITQLVIIDLQGNILFHQAFKHDSQPWYVLPSDTNLVNSADLLPFNHYFNQIQSIFYSATMLIGFETVYYAEPFLYDAGIELLKVPVVDIKGAFCELAGYPPEITGIFDVISYFHYDDNLTSQNSTLVDLTKAIAFAYNEMRQE